MTSMFLILAVIIPTIMIIIGILYKLNLNKKIKKITDLLIPASAFIRYLLNNKLDLKIKMNFISFGNIKRSSAWIRLGVVTLIFSIIIFILHNDNIFNTFITLSKLQLIILFFTYITIEYVLK